MADETQNKPETPEPGPEAAPALMDADALKKALEDQTKRAESNLANWQRAQADLINYRKKVDQEKKDLVAAASVGLLAGLLPVVDDLERALGTIDLSIAGLMWIDGIRLISRKLQAFLDAQGVTAITAAGEPFNPSMHQAVMEMDGEEGRVLAELQRGYKMGDRVLRPAMVTVGRGKTPVDGTQPEPSEAPNNA